MRLAGGGIQCLNNFLKINGALVHPGSTVYQKEANNEIRVIGLVDGSNCLKWELISSDVQCSCAVITSFLHRKWCLSCRFDQPANGIQLAYPEESHLYDRSAFKCRSCRFPFRSYLDTLNGGGFPLVLFGFLSHHIWWARSLWVKGVSNQ